jgi:iron-hydrogenase subunit gamma
VELEEFVQKSVVKNGKFLIPTLQDLQEEYRYLPEDGMRMVAQVLNIPLRDVYGVASFYSAFSFTPKGDYIVTVCTGTACHVRAGAKIAGALKTELGIGPGETTEDLMFSLETVNCLGCCAIGPVVVVNGNVHPNMNINKTLKLIRDIQKGGQCG